MSFQAYLDTIREKTGLGPDDFRALAADRGLVGPAIKAGDVITWLAEDYGLGRGHAMAIVAVLKSEKSEGSPRETTDADIDKHFAGAKAAWRPVYDAILARLNSLGSDVAVAPTGSYISFVRDGRKFAIVAITAKRLDIGLKLKHADPGMRFEASGNWNNMVTHRVRIADAAEVDDEVYQWLEAAYASAE